MAGLIQRFIDDRAGATALMVGLLAPALIGAAGLAVDVNLLLLQSHRLQIAADAAAYAAGLMLANTAAQAAAPASFQTIAANAVAGETGGTLIGNGVTTSVAVAANYTSVTVTIAANQPSSFSALFGIVGYPMQATATASAATSAPSSCVLALAPVTSAILMSNAGAINANKCGVFSNSADPASISVVSGTITAGSIGAVGSIVALYSNVSPSPVGGKSAIPDPDKALVPPAAGGCTYTNYNFSGPQSFRAGTVFCGNTNFAGWGPGSPQTFAPGTYYIVNGNLNFSSAGPTGTGVTFIFSGTAPGGLIFSNGSIGSFTAPTAGSTAGMFIWQTCPAVGLAVPSILGGGAVLNFSGTVYLPCSLLALSNNAQLTSGSATASVIAYQLSLVGSAGITVTGGAGASGTGATTVTLTQ